MFLQLRFSHASLCLGISVIALFFCHSLFAQEFIKTKNTGAKSKVINIIQEIPRSYVTWSGGVKDKYANGSGNLIVWKYNRRRKDYEKYLNYHNCIMQSGKFVSVEKLNSLSGKFEYSGSLSPDGKIEGSGEITYLDTRSRLQKYSGDFLNGEPSGKGKVKYTHGADYEGAFKNGLPEGEGTYTFPDKSRYVGQFKDGQKNGQGKLYQVNGDSCIGTWMFDKKNGDFTYYFAKGSHKPIHLTFENGISKEYDAYKDATQYQVLSGYYQFLNNFPTSELVSEIRNKVRKEESKLTPVYRTGFTKGRAKNNEGKFVELFIGEDWEMVFEVDNGDFDLLSYYTVNKSWRSNKLLATDFPLDSERKLNPGWYSLIKTRNKLTLYKGSELIESRTMNAYGWDCTDYFWIGFGTRTPEGTQLVSMKKKIIRTGMQKREYCDFKAINQLNITDMDAFLKKHPTSSYAYQVRQMKQKRLNQITQQNRDERERRIRERQEEEFRRIAFSKLQIGDKLCYTMPTSERDQILGFTLSQKDYAMIVTGFIERIAGNKYQLRISSYRSTRRGLSTTPVIDGQKVYRGDIIWVEPTSSKRWSICN